MHPIAAAVCYAVHGVSHVMFIAVFMGRFHVRGDGRSFVQSTHAHENNLHFNLQLDNTSDCGRIF